MAHSSKPSLAERLASLIFPTRCICCGRLSRPCKYVCDDCRAELELCKVKRAKAVSYYGRPFSVHSVYSYKSAAASAVKQLKFAYNSDGAKPMGDEIAAKALRLRNGGYDVVAAVPMTAEKTSKRGFNQSELIAKRVAGNLGVPYDSRCLTKTRETKQQHFLSGLERRENVCGAFSAGDADGKSVLLIDDVVTTGATICECATCLLDAGAKTVTCITFAATKYSN